MLLALNSYGQDKYNHVHFNKLIEVEGSDFVVASIENRGKLDNTKGRYLLFIDTKTGQTNQVDFPYEIYPADITQVKIDELAINRIIVCARTIDLNGQKGVDWNDPLQIVVLSVDGKEKTQLTDSNLFVKTWTVNKKTATIVVTGHYDTNNNGKHDKTDKNEILIYDVKTLELLHKI